MVPFLMAGVSLLQGIRAANQAKATDITSKANTNIANIQRVSQNKANAANASLQRMAKSINNQQVMRSAGKKQEDLSLAQVRLTEEMMTGQFSSRLKASAEAGALVASAGAAGIGGSTVDQLDQVNNLNQYIVEQAMGQEYDRQYFANTQAQDELVYQTYQALDDTLILDNLQVAEIIGPPKQFQGYGGALMSAGLSLVSGMYQTGELSKGGMLDLSRERISGIFNTALGRTQQGTSGSNYQLGARLIGD